MSLLEMVGVTVRFGGKVVLADVGIAAAPGAVTGLIGPNGAGKTTTFNVVTGLQRPAAGRVVLDGRDVTRLAPYRRARLGMARTFQRLELFGQLTVRENIAVAAGLRRQWGGRRREPDDRLVGRLVERVGLGHIADTRTDTLSTGQGRLVELARALAIRPRLLLLDEPASGQDAAETDRFADLLRTLADDGVAVLLVEHDVELVMRVCSWIHVLDFGELIAAGTPAEIQADTRVRAAYLGGAGA